MEMSVGETVMVILFVVAVLVFSWLDMYGYLDRVSRGDRGEEHLGKRYKPKKGGMK